MFVIFNGSNMILADIYDRFPSKDECIKYLESKRWGNIPICPHCYSQRSTKTRLGFRHHCNNCNTSYSVLVNTIFHKTKVDLQKWFYAIFLLLNPNYKVSFRDLGKKLNITKDTAWRISESIKVGILKKDILLERIIQDINEENL